MVRTSFNTMALPHSRGRKGIFVSLTSSPHAFSRNPKLPVKPSWQSWMAGILLNQWLQPSHALCPPMDVSGSPHRACKVRFVSKCLHTSICSFQMLFSYIQLWGRKKKTLQLLVHNFQCERHRYMVVGISATPPLTPEKRITFKNGNLIKNRK